MRRLFALIVVLCSLALVGPARASAQDATPAAPDPSTCTVAPRPIAFFEQFVGTPAADQATPAMAAATPAAAFQMPAGEPADEATVAAVLETVSQAGACVNAGNFLAFYALYTDDFFRLEPGFHPLAEEVVAFLAATPEPLPAENRAALLAVLDVRELADGRVAALVDVVDPFGQPPGPARFYYVFAEEGGRWLIDEQAMLGPIEPAQVGTPTP